MTHLGDFRVLVAVGVATAVLLRITGLPRAAVAVAPRMSLLKGGIVVATLKPLIGRARPPLALHAVTESG